MTGGQWRVLVILLAILGLEVATSPNTRAFLADMGKVISGDQKTVPAKDLAGAPGILIGFALGALVLVALAAWQEGLATAIAVIFLVIVLITRGDVIGPAAQAATDALKARGGK